MANRCLLHKNHLECFKEWLIENNWKIESPKGDYEVLRARKESRVLLVYRGRSTEHYSVNEKFTRLVRSFLKMNNK